MTDTLSQWETEAKISYSDSFVEPIDLANRRNSERILALIFELRKAREALKKVEKET